MFKRIIVAVDLSYTDVSTRTLVAAANLARATDAQIQLVYVRYIVDLAADYLTAMTLKGDEKDVLEKLRVLADSCGLPADRASVSSPIGRIYSEILSAAEKFDADLIVTGPHSPSMTKFLLGTDAASIVKHSPISVLVVR